MQFHEALTLARLELGMTQQEAGEYIGLSRDSAKRTFSYYERGVREPGADRVQNIRALLALAIDRARSNHGAPKGSADAEDSASPVVATI